MEKLWVIWALISPVEGYTFINPGPFATKDECIYSVYTHYGDMQNLIVQEYKITGNRIIPIYCVNKKLMEEFMKKGDIRIERDKE